MDLHTVQLIFYTLGSIVFVSLIILLIFITAVILIVRRKISKTTRQINFVTDQIMDIYENKEKYFLRLLGKGSSSLFEGITNIFTKKK